MVAAAPGQQLLPSPQLEEAQPWSPASSRATSTPNSQQHSPAVSSGGWGSASGDRGQGGQRAPSQMQLVAGLNQLLDERDPAGAVW